MKFQNWTYEFKKSSVLTDLLIHNSHSHIWCTDFEWNSSEWYRVINATNIIIKYG